MPDASEQLRRVLSDRYELEGEVGAGGMATVYAARDARHGRRVAVKVLRPELAASVGHERFLREIAVTSQLNHPRILPLLDSGAVGELLYYVMPYVEGETLRERLTRDGALPVEEALEIARGVAVALGHAHAHAVVHRDIKPENIFLTAGEAVVADFGIAQAVSEAGGTKLTETGIAVGTPAYMSPEQAAGQQHVDGRSDLYAVGCVLYEMLVGEPPYTGPTAQAITARKLTEPVPSVRTVRDMVPVMVEEVVRKALARAPADRYATAAQLIAALSTAATPVPGTMIATGVAPDEARRWKLLTAVASVVALAAIAFWRPWSTAEAPAAGAVYRLPLPIAPLAVSEHGAAPQVALSPDGRRLAWVSGEGGTGQLYIRALASSEAIPVNGASNAQGPFFSPDGEWLGFATGDTLKKVRLSDGTLVTLCRAGWLHGATWGPDGTIVFSGVVDQSAIGIGSVPEDGGSPTVVLLPDSSRDEAFLMYPSFLPDGRTVLITGGGVSGEAVNISSLSLATRERRVLLEGGGNAVYVPTGHLVYGQDGALFAVPFDAAKGQVHGTAVRIVPDVLMNLPLEPAIAHFTVSLDGTLVYLPGRSAIVGASGEVVWARSTGETDTIPGFRRAVDQADVGIIGGPRVSPDGRRLLFWSYTRDAKGGLAMPSNEWVYDTQQRTLTKLSVETPTWFFAIWMPDGRDVVAAVGDSATKQLRLFRKRADGVGPAVPLTTEPGASFQQAYSVSRDGRTVLFHQSTLGGPSVVRVLDTRSGEVSTLLDGPASESHPALSPDGRWLAYESNQGRQAEVYVTDFPGHTGRWQVSSGGGIAPAWAPDGTQLYFQRNQFSNVERAEAFLMSASFDGRSAAPAIGTPVEALRGPYDMSNQYGRQYDIAPGGDRFLMVRRRPLSASLNMLTVVVNWFTELQAATAPDGRGKAARP